MTIFFQFDGLEVPVPEEEIDTTEMLYGSQLPEWAMDPSSLPSVYRQVLKRCLSVDGWIDTAKLQPVLMTSNLPKSMLGTIWEASNKKCPGTLNEVELYLVLGMVALAQVSSYEITIIYL